MASRFVVGIDLGTTNCALAYVDTGAAGAMSRRCQHLPIPQVVQPGVVEERPLLPSFLYLPGPERAAGREPASCRGRRTAITPSASSPATSAARCRRGWSPPPSRGCAIPASIAARRSCRGRRRRTAAGSRRWRPATLYLKHLVEAWNSSDRQGRRRESAREPGHHPDRAGVVRRRGPRADRRGGPGGRAGAPHAAGGAAGRVLRLARRQPGRAGASRSRSATSCWSATSAAAPPT